MVTWFVSSSLVLDVRQASQHTEKRVKSWIPHFCVYCQSIALLPVHWSASVFGYSRKDIWLVLNKSYGISSGSRTLSACSELWSMFAECPPDSHVHLRFNVSKLSGSLCRSPSLLLLPDSVIVFTLNLDDLFGCSHPSELPMMSVSLSQCDGRRGPAVSHESGQV